MNFADLKFKDYDGRPVVDGTGAVKRMITIEDANELLRAKLAKAEQVFGRHDAGGGCNVWDNRRMPWDLYQARLVCVEPVPPKERA